MMQSVPSQTGMDIECGSAWWPLVWNKLPAIINSVNKLLFMFPNKLLVCALTDKKHWLYRNSVHRPVQLTIGKCGCDGSCGEVWVWWEVWTCVVSSGLLNCLRFPQSALSQRRLMCGPWAAPSTLLPLVRHRVWVSAFWLVTFSTNQIIPRPQSMWWLSTVSNEWENNIPQNTVRLYRALPLNWAAFMMLPYSSYSQEFCDLIGWILQVAPEARPSVGEIEERIAQLLEQVDQG